MQNKIYTSHVNLKELIFQILLHIMVFIFFGFDRRLPGIESHQVYFFLNYALAALIINYVLLPYYLYKNRYLQFSIYTLVIVALVIYVEEAILEQLFYPDTRGKKFMGVFYNLLSTMPTVTILVGFKFAWDALKKQQEVIKLRNSVKESELQFLKSQINPHFLFNNLNNMYAYAVEKSPKTPEIILELASVLRYMLYESKARFVPLKKEMEHIENYINLSKLHIEGRGVVDFKLEIPPSNFRIAPLILTVFIENAFKHSASSQTNNIAISITANLDAHGMLHFTCKNNFLEQSNTTSLDSGIGLKNVKKRLELIYPKAHTLEIRTENDFYLVDLKIDLSKCQEE
ncbi:histidine kinase [Oceanihabitans sp. IOP_32]|uniref:sensor histidine kinase n=1 Tax=Oceanihabitans sp. IOP_32 TaxID=2529032 RepID=UPI001293750F|nr:histidine kinase [Oceanihabitans sp. IOP_32]QFZ54979.1 histidine kinase [Oceanihabitans sp. IOP_32]